MKTLDEVIAEMEGIGFIGTGADALHYLKTIETTENLYHDAVNKLSKWEDEDWKDRCLPLTWDELRTMEGKPVWVEWTLDEGYDIEVDGSTYQEWLFIYSWRGKDKQILIATDSEGAWHDFYQERQGTEWQAYRKERD